jgi:hypothetical protein
MATSVTINTNYKGAEAQDFYIAAFKKADTIEKGAITILPNIIGEGYMPTMQYSAALAPFSCGFLSTGAFSYSEKVITPKKFEHKAEFCKEIFSQNFEAAKAGLYSATPEIPSSFEVFIINEMVNQVATGIDNMIWNGTGGTFSINGLLGKLTADANTIKITATPITKANVQAEIEKVYDAIPDSIMDEADLIFVVANNVAKKYKQSQIGNYLTGSAPGDKELDYLGIPMVSLNYLPANTMLVYKVSNLALGTGLQADFNNVSVVDMDDTDLSSNIRTRIVFSIGVEYNNAAEVVLYK